jgi:hypothetical protein
MELNIDEITEAVEARHISTLEGGKLPGYQLKAIKRRQEAVLIEQNAAIDIGFQ